MQGRVTKAIGIALAATVNACGLVVSTDGLTGGTLDGGSPDSATHPPSPDAGPDGLVADAASEDAGDHPPPGTTDATTADAATFDAGQPDGASLTCAGDLSNIGKGNFEVSFLLITTQPGSAALVNQRAKCSSGDFWDIRLLNGGLKVETDDGASDTQLGVGSPVLNDGALHSVVVQRASGVLSILLDGAVAATGASSASFGALAALQAGTDVCDGTDGTAPLVGTISNVCVANH